MRIMMSHGRVLKMTIVDLKILEKTFLEKYETNIGKLFFHE